MVTEAQIEQRQQAGRKHGIHAFESRGPQSLDPVRVDRLIELRELVKSHPGRMELRRELAARAALIVDIAMGELIKTHKSGKSIWTSPVIRRMGSYMAELRRILDSFPNEDELGHASDIINQVMRDNGKDDS